MNQNIHKENKKTPLFGFGLQYISQGKAPHEHLENIEKFCEAGGRWVQLRLKGVDMAAYVNTAIKCREICDHHEAIMIINDHISVAQAAKADGIHLGLEDMNPKEARKILGKNYIIGGTANTVEDCLQHQKDGVDYIGLGPFRHTTTKKKLSPILGFDGYEKIMLEFNSNDDQNSELPIVAIGGILESDIEALLKTGVSGIAVSGMLTNQDDLEKKIEKIKMLMAYQLEANR